MEGRESALAVVVPEAEPLVGEWRLRHDPSAAVGVPAHITVMHPFLPPARIDEGVLTGLAGVFAAEPVIDYRLTEVRRFDDGVLYLAPDPAAPFSRLIVGVGTRFDIRPYGGAIDDPIPHLTVVHGGPADTLDVVEAAIAPGLPIAAQVRDVTLFVLGSDGRWRKARRFPLAEGVT